MIEQVCAFIHNYFEIDAVTGRQMIYPGQYTISEGAISLPFLADGQYYRIMGSNLNDGVHMYHDHDNQLHDETFSGVIWKMRPPRAFLDVVAEIEAFVSKYGGSAATPYQSESVVGVYSYSKSGDGSWQSVFSPRLRSWRKLA